jgi:hypothetical protein
VAYSVLFRQFCRYPTLPAGASIQEAGAGMRGRRSEEKDAKAKIGLEDNG